MARTEWVLNWPGQVTIAGCQTYWTMEVAQALEAGNISSKLFPQLSKQVGLMKISVPHIQTPNTSSPAWKRGKVRSMTQIRFCGASKKGPKEGSETGHCLSPNHL